MLIGALVSNSGRMQIVDKHSATSHVSPLDNDNYGLTLIVKDQECNCVLLTQESETRKGKTPGVSDKTCTWHISSYSSVHIYDCTKMSSVYCIIQYTPSSVTPFP